MTPENQRRLLERMQALLPREARWRYFQRGRGPMFVWTVEPFNLMWLEMDMFDPKALSLIRQSTTTPIGSLETILGRRNLKPYLENHTVDVAIIDAQWNGLVEAAKMAAVEAQ